MFIYDLHVHTSCASGCGHNTVEEMIKRYKEIGFTGFALTNHFYNGNTGVERSLSWENFVKEFAKGYYDALETAQKLDFDLLFGLEELYRSGKEFLVYGISPELLIKTPELKTGDIKVWSQFVKENNGFIAYAHPFRKRGYIPDPNTMPDISLVDGLEIYNYSNTEEDNTQAAETFKNSGKIFITGGDLHSVNFDNSFGIKTTQRIKTTEQLAAVLKANKFELYLGK